MSLQAPDLDNPDKASKPGYEDGEQAAVSTPPIADVGLTPRKRKHAAAAAQARPGATPVTAAEGPASKQPRLEVVSEGGPLLPSHVERGTASAASRVPKATAGIDSPAVIPYVHAARGAYAAAAAVAQRSPAPSLLGPASKPLDVTLQVWLQSSWARVDAHTSNPSPISLGTQLGAGSCDAGTMR
jgi:hypothetical protein